MEATQTFPSNGFFWQKLFYLIPDMAGNTNQLKSPLEPVNAGWASTTASLWKKSVVDEFGWFEKGLRTGEDSQLAFLAHNAGYQFLLAPVRVVQDYRPDLQSFIKQQFWYGVGAGVRSRKHAGLIKTRKSVLYNYFVWSFKCGLKYGLRFVFPLMLVQPFKHVINLAGVWRGHNKGKKVFE